MLNKLRPRKKELHDLNMISQAYYDLFSNPKVTPRPMDLLKWVRAYRKRKKEENEK